MITGKNYIGDLLSAKGDITFRTIDPVENIENESLFFEAADDEIDQAVTLATKAFKEYSSVSDSRKADFLEAIVAEIELLGDDLLQIYTKESGLPVGRANGERTRTMVQLTAFATMLREGSWVEAIISKVGDTVDIRRMLIPIGPVVVFGASNFPLAFSTAGGDTASALAAGCPVIVKSHPLHAGTGEMVASAIIKAAQKTGMPNGVFSNLNSHGISVGVKLVEHPAIKAVGFTGSVKGGTALCEIAAKREVPIPVYAEMSSINPVVVLPSVLQKVNKEWAQKYAAAITMGTGQFCTNPGLILGIASKELDDFATNLALELKAIQPSCMLHPNIKALYESHKKEILAQEDYTQLTDLDIQVKENFALPNLISVSGSLFLKNKAFHNEVFGPFSVVVKCESQQQLDAIIENLEGQLTGTILNADVSELESFKITIDTLKNRVGRLIFNSVPTGVEVCSAMTHGGPYPSTSDSKFTSVGITAVKRWVRPVSFQGWPNEMLPDALKNENPLSITRTLNDAITKDSI